MRKVILKLRNIKTKEVRVRELQVSEEQFKHFQRSLNKPQNNYVLIELIESE